MKLPELNQRTDADLTHEAENMLNWWTYLPTGAVKVRVDNGRIFLSGKVEWDYQRRAAMDAICHVLGVGEISDQITVEGRDVRALSDQSVVQWGLG